MLQSQSLHQPAQRGGGKQKPLAFVCREEKNANFVFAFISETG
jgi:hypothetical protein